MNLFANRMSDSPVSASQMKPTKTGDGSYLEITFEITEGEYRGRKLWDRLCINHPNSTTVKIARGNLSAICRAVGVMQPRDSVELHNLPLQINVKCKKRKDTGDLTNEIKGYEAKQAAKTQTSAPPSAAPAASTAAQTTTPPWKR